MVKDEHQVEKLLQPRPENAELDYPTEPHYEAALPVETAAENKQRKQCKMKIRSDWQNNRNSKEENQ